MDKFNQNMISSNKTPKFSTNRKNSTSFLHSKTPPQNYTTAQAENKYLLEEDFLRGVRSLMSTRYTDRELKDLW